MYPFSQKWLTKFDQAFRSTLPQREDGSPAELSLLQREIAEWWINDPSRFCLLLGGERAGKSLESAYLAGAGLNPTLAGEFWFVGPDYRQARVEFQYMYNALSAMGHVVKASMPLAETAPWSFHTTWGLIFKTRSSNDIAKLASFKVVGAIVCEAAQHEYAVFLKLMGRVAETKGMLILSGTLERGQSWYIDLYKRWRAANPLGARSFSLPTWANEAAFPGGRDNPEIRQLEDTYPPDLFMERYGGEPRKLQGLVIPEFDMEKHVRHLEPDPKLPVELAVDPGQHCYAVLFIQKWGLTTYVLDRIYERNKIAQEIIPMAMENPLFKLIDPAQSGVIDNAGKQRHANKSQVELWREIAGLNLRSQYIHLKDTIDTVRFRLRDTNPQHAPLIFFNDHMMDIKSPDGMAMDILAEFDLWKWPDKVRDADANKPVNPVDRNNDAIKALGYYLVDVYGAYVDKPALPEPVRQQYWGVPNYL